MIIELRNGEPVHISTEMGELYDSRESVDAMWNFLETIHTLELS